MSNYKTVEARNKARKKYYYKHSINKINKFKSWEDKEDQIILLHSASDVSISIILGRTVGSIQKRRCILNKK